MTRNILLVQHDPSDAKAVREALINSSDGQFRVKWVRRYSEGLERLASEGNQVKQRTDGVAAILVDLFLPDSQGIETFDRLFRVAPHIPILVLSSPQDEDVAKVAVKRGAQDYLLKGRFDSYTLPKALRSMVERAAIADALFDEKERAQVTLNSIGDAVMSSDIGGQVTYLNPVAERMTGWSLEEAVGHPLEEVFRIIDGTTREAVQNPMALAIQENKTVGVTSNCVLVRRDGVRGRHRRFRRTASITTCRRRCPGAVKWCFNDVSTARALSVRMSHLAQHDGLTDLPNRITLNDRLTQAANSLRLTAHTGKKTGAS